jgi:maltooligosyltrehalose trehalohydrolase
VDIGKYREQEFAAYGWDPTQMIDPQDPHAFADSVLDWNELAEPGHTQIRELYRNLIALRRTETDLADPRLDQITVDFDEDERWLVVRRGSLRVAVNFDDRAQTVPVPLSAIVLATGEATPAEAGVTLGPQTAAIVRML